MASNDLANWTEVVAPFTGPYPFLETWSTVPATNATYRYWKIEKTDTGYLYLNEVRFHVTAP